MKHTIILVFTLKPSFILGPTFISYQQGQCLLFPFVFLIVLISFLLIYISPFSLKQTHPTGSQNSVLVFRNRSYFRQIWTLRSFRPRVFGALYPIAVNAV